MKPKLIRDSVPQILSQKNIHHRIRTADELEYSARLDEKLLEEVNEFLASKNIEELADILEVIHALAANQKSSVEEIEKIRVRKKVERGGFSKRIILDELN